jgi:hypothetical protein
MSGSLRPTANGASAPLAQPVFHRVSRKKKKRKRKKEKEKKL